MTIAAARDSTATFFDRVAKHPILSAEQEQRLARKMRAGDRQAREELVRCNMRLVISIALPWRHRGLEFEDLFQEGCIGLEKALDKFDPDRGYKLSTYATWWIKQAVQRAAANKSETIRAPIHVQDRAYKIKLLREKEPELTDAQVAERLGATEQQIREAITAPRASVSIDAERSEETVSWADSIADDNSPDPYAEAMREGAAIPIRKAIKDLPSPIDQVIQLRFGIEKNSGEPMSIAQVGEALNIPGHRVSNLQREGLEMLREVLGESFAPVEV